MTFEEAVAHALTLPGAQAATAYGKPAVKANGNGYVGVGHEPDTSFVLLIDRDTVATMIEVHPETFWQTPHYAGYAAMLVRYDSPHDDVVRDMIARAHAQAMAKKPPRARKAKG